MGKKPQILPLLLRAPPRKLPWQFFPPCAFSPKTLSFHATVVVVAGDDIFKTVNSVYFDPTETLDPWFTTSLEVTVSFTIEDDMDRDTCTKESVVRGVRSSERLFFNLNNTRSILEQAKAGTGLPFKQSEFMAWSRRIHTEILGDRWSRWWNRMGLGIGGIIGLGLGIKGILGK